MFYVGCMTALIICLAFWISLALVVLFLFKWLVLLVAVLLALGLARNVRARAR